MMNRMKLNYAAQLCVITHPLTQWMQIIQRLRYTFYHRINGNELTTLVHWNNSLLHARTIQLWAPTAMGVCCWLQSCLNKLDGVLIEQGRPTMLSQEINQYGAFEMRHIGEALKKPCSHGTRLRRCRHAECLKSSKRKVIPLLWVWQQEIIKKMVSFCWQEQTIYYDCYKKKINHNTSSRLWISGLNTSMLVIVQSLEPSLSSRCGTESESVSVAETIFLPCASADLGLQGHCF